MGCLYTWELWVPFPLPNEVSLRCVLAALAVLGWPPDHGWTLASLSQLAGQVAVPGRITQCGVAVATIWTRQEPEREHRRQLQVHFLFQVPPSPRSLCIDLGFVRDILLYNDYLLCA